MREDRDTAADDAETPEQRLGAELRRLRIRAGLSVRTLAAELHRAHSGIVEYETGRRLPPVEVVEQYEQFFDLAVGALVAQRERARVARLDEPRDATTAEHLAHVVCPYKGLRAFEYDDAALFFGREPQVQRVLAQLAEARFAAVIGASGSGKSSFVRAGLLASIAARRGAARSSVALLTPGARPLDELARAVGKATGCTVGVEQLRADPGALDRTTREAPGGGLVVAVDQLEELFTLCREEQPRRHFIDALVTAWRDPASAVTVIVALRADFYGHVAAYPQFGAAIVAHQTLLGPMDPTDLRRAIELPAAKAGLSLQPGLAETMLDDIGQEPGALPLLSHALLETWKRRRRLTLTVAGYHEAGGVSGALAQTAERTLQALPDADRAIARSIFLRLTDVDEGTEPTRRRVDRSDLAEDSVTNRVLGVLADARLVTLDDRTVVVAHEALIRHWPRLRGWVDADRAGLLVHQRLAVAAREWDALGREGGALYRGARLAAALDWARDHREDLSPPERAFLDASQAGEQRHARRGRLLLAGITAALGVSLVLAVMFYVQRQTARSQTLAARAIDAARSDPEQSLRLALDAADAGEGSLVVRAVREAVAAAGWTRILRGDTRLPINAIDFSPDGRLAVSAGEDATASIWSVDSGRRIASMRHEDDVRSVRFDPGGRRIVTASADGTARVWDGGGHLVRVLRPGGDVHSAAFDRSGRLLITATAGGDAQVWDLVRPRAPLRLAGEGAGRLDVASFSPDGRRALTPGASGRLRLWTIGPRPHFVTLLPAEGPVANVTVATFSPDGRRVLAGYDAGMTCVWELGRAGARSRSCHDGSDTITAVGFSRGGGLFVTASAAGDAEIRSSRDARTLTTVRHLGPINAAAFSPRGDRVLTAGDDRVARVWTTRGRLQRVLRGHTDAVREARFDHSGRRVLTGSDDGSARLWSARDPDKLPGRALRGADVAFSPNSRMLLAVDEIGSAAIWDLRRRTRRDLRGAMVPNDGGGLLACDRFTGCQPWSPDSASVAGASASYEATVWAANSGAARPLAVGDATGAAFSPDGTRLAITRLERPALVVDRFSGQRIAAVPRGSRVWVSSAQFAGDGRRVLTVDINGTAVISDAARGTSAGPRAAATVPGAAAVSADGAQLAVGTRSGALRVYDVAGRRMRATPEGRGLTSVEFDRTGTRIVAASDDLTAKVWRAGALAVAPVVLRGHRDRVLGASFSPDGRFVLTVALDGTARVWDAAFGTSILVLPTSGHGAARFSPDGRLIAIGGRGTVELHRCEPCQPVGALLRLARSRLPVRR